MPKEFFNRHQKILVQSMTNTKTHDISATLAQINLLAQAGCDLVRVAVFDDIDAAALPEIVQHSPLPIIADIHFNYQLALKAIEAGVFKIRLNPGNMENITQVRAIIEAAQQHGTYIRIGVNCGSLPVHIVEKYGVTSQAMLLTMDEYLKIFEEVGFQRLVLSLKASDPLLNLEVNRAAAQRYSYPLHIGVTEAGTLENATIKSTIGLAPLILEDIGDTVRISISDDPVKEVQICIKLLNILKKRNDRVDIVSCPTCGRLDYNLFAVVKEIEEYCTYKFFPLKIAILGCVVNGIGEAKHADIGIAGSRAGGILFADGKILKQCREADLVPELKALIDQKYQAYLTKNPK